MLRATAPEAALPAYACKVNALLAKLSFNSDLFMARRCGEEHYALFYDAELIACLGPYKTLGRTEPPAMWFGYTEHRCKANRWTVLQSNWIDERLPEKEMPLSFYIKREIARLVLFEGKYVLNALDSQANLITRYRRVIERLERKELILQLGD